MDRKKQIINRLKTIQGHLGGVIQMIEENKECHDILVQMKAISSGVSKAQGLIFEEYLERCLELSPDDQAKVRDVLKRLI